MAVQIEEVKASRSLVKSLDSFTFKEQLFAYFVTRSDIKVQRRLFQIFIECIWIWAEWYDNDDWDTPEGMNLYAEAKSVQDQLIKFGYQKKD